MNHRDLFKLLSTVHKNVRCPQCGRSYSFSDIKIRGVIDSICFLELYCKDHMPLIATVALSQTEKESHQEKIKVNDVIETHRFLKHFRGGFEQMFK